MATKKAKGPIETIKIGDVFYVPMVDFGELEKNYNQTIDKVQEVLDKWFMTLEGRMNDQENLTAMAKTNERLIARNSELQRELRLLTKTIHELKMSVMENRELEKRHEQIVLGADPAEFAKKFNMRFDKPIPAFGEPQPEETPEEFNDRTRHYDCE